MKPAFKSLLKSQLDESLRESRPVRKVLRPRSGWLRAIRISIGLSQQQIAKRLGKTKQHVAYLEAAEASERITVKTLRAAANAMECDLFYVLLPRPGSLENLSKLLWTDEVQKYVDAVQHTMTLENQSISSAHFQKRLQSEISKRTKKG